MANVYVEPTGRRVQPFDDPVGDVLIANTPLSEHLDAAIAEAGLTRIDRLEPPCLVIPDALFTTGPILQRFVDGADGKDAVLGLQASRFGERTTPVQPDVHAVDGGWRFDAIRFVADGAEPALVWVDPEEDVVELDLPRPFRDPGDEDELTRISLPRHPVMTVHHWVHVLWANQAAGASQARRAPKWLVVLKVLWAVLRSLSLNRWKILRRLNTVGKGCDIHPTAVVEGSTLGDGVTVGPYARVLFSHVGDGAQILPGAHVELSTLGPRATAAQMTGMRLCVLYPEAFHGQGMMQACVLGRGTLTTLASYFIDLNFDRTIRVPLDGALHDTGTRFLGSAVGHGSRIGTGVWLAPGRALPNGTIWIRDPGDVAARIPEQPLDGSVVTVDGSLVPWRRDP